ncbi:MAG TPA: DUF3489 domain-containing protein [Sphingomicrobium sp.]|nr:DUF3489 domain-containing protein [Sphingomicrobium sp.]
MARTRKASAGSNNAATKAELPPTATTSASPSKIAGVIALLQRSDGASLAELVENTGWLPHTIRAALTGLRKKGHTIDKLSREGVTAYSIKG